MDSDNKQKHTKRKTKKQIKDEEILEMLMEFNLEENICNNPNCICKDFSQINT